MCRTKCPKNTNPIIKPFLSTDHRFYIISRIFFTPAQIAHECVHIANWVCERCGVLLEYRNDEALAYLVEYLFEEISKIVNQGGNCD